MDDQDQRRSTAPLAAQALAVRLLDRLPMLAERLRDAIVDNDDAYAVTTLVTREELMRSCLHNMTRSVQVLADRVPDGVDAFDAARRTAVGRADAGFPLESLLHAYRLGTEVLWGALLEEARANAPDLLGELLDDAVSVMQLIDQMSLAAATAYRTRVEQADQRDRARRQAVLDLLLEGKGGDPAVEDRALRILGLQPDTRHAVVVVGHDEPGSAMSTPAELLAVYGFVSEWRLAADREIGLVALGQAPVRRLADVLRSGGVTSAGVSPAFAGLGDVPANRHLAELALDTVPDGGSVVAELEEWLPEALLVAKPDLAARIRERTFAGLQSLGEGKRTMLLQTLESWFRTNRSTNKMGAELHCHRNTVLHRLARIEELTGHSLDDDRDVLLLRLALLVERPHPTKRSHG